MLGADGPGKAEAEPAAVRGVPSSSATSGQQASHGGELTGAVEAGSSAATT